MGWKAWRNPDLSKKTVICSIDKDLDTVPGHHFRWQTHNKDEEHYFLDEKQAMLNYWQQVLTGDNADNIRGLYRIGEKRAKSILNGCETEYEFYKTCMRQWEVNFEKYGIEQDPFEEMHKTCKLLYLMKDDNDTGFVPPTEKEYYG
jgi:5'-3' exonuclease